MTGNRVLLTGATGFIGSHFAHHLINAGYKIIATKREQSDFSRVQDIRNEIIWINTNHENWDKKIIENRPDILIHTAWEGVKASDRNDWKLQSGNYDFSMHLFNLCIEGGVKKVIALGSQDEYGIYSGRINELYLPQPADAYGTAKLSTSHYMRIICQGKNIPWYWLRVFSVFGPDENPSWLLPQVIRSLTLNKPIALTPGEQSYDFMYISDFIQNVSLILNKSDNNSGIYNLGSGEAISIKALLSKLPKLLSVSENLLQFGKIPYRQVQSMHMESDSEKFRKEFGRIIARDIDSALNETVEYYKNRI
jgi:nucleoside-diphosphate-sugar epimerase